MDNDPLRRLVVDEQEIARGELADALEGLVRFGETGGVLPLPSFDELPAVHKVACVLLAFRAMNLLGLRDRPGATPQEIEQASGIPGGTVRPKLSELVRDRIARRENGDYAVGSYAMSRVARELRERGGR